MLLDRQSPCRLFAIALPLHQYIYIPWLLVSIVGPCETEIRSCLRPGTVLLQNIQEMFQASYHILHHRWSIANDAVCPFRQTRAHCPGQQMNGTHESYRAICYLLFGRKFFCINFGCSCIDNMFLLLDPNFYSYSPRDSLETFGSRYIGYFPIRLLTQRSPTRFLRSLLEVDNHLRHIFKKVRSSAIRSSEGKQRRHCAQSVRCESLRRHFHQGFRLSSSIC